MSIRIVTPQEAYDLLESAKRRLIDTAQRVKVDGPRKAGMYMIKRAREAAPRDSGHLVQNIRGMPKGKGYEVNSIVTVGWAYNEWINMGPNQKTSWGRSYPQVKKTGKPGFFSWAREMTRAKFNNITLTEVKSYRVVE